MTLKEEIKKILEERAHDLCYDECGNSLQKNKYEIDKVEIDKLVELILELVNDQPD